MPQCKISCGDCCDAWSTVRALAEKYHEEVVDVASTCPEQGEHGCSLPRDKRPQVCREFLCDLAQAVEDKKMSLAWAVKYLGEVGSAITVWGSYNDNEFKTKLTLASLLCQETLRHKAEEKGKAYSAEQEGA